MTRVLRSEPAGLSSETREAKARRADLREYPEMLYKRDGDELRTLTVKDPVDKEAAVKDGWRESP